MKNLFLVLLGITALLPSASAQVSVPKGSVTQIMNGGRVLDCKEITAADLPYTKGIGTPFTIMIVPKSTSNTSEVEIVEGRLYQSNVAGPVPLTVNNWNVSAFVTLTSTNTALFTNYRVFVGFGQSAD